MSNRIKRVVSFVLVEVLLLTSIISISTNFRVNASNGVTVCVNKTIKKVHSNMKNISVLENN